MSRAHRGEHDGVLEDGGVRRRCNRCGVCEHWEAARLDCELAIHATSRQPRPGAPVVTVPCVLCGTLFARHARVLHVRYCGDKCILEARRESNRKAQARYAAKKREARCN